MSDYNAADNSAKSYALAIETMREKLASFRKEVIGDCTLFLGDCRDILPTLGKVDAVDKSHAVVFNQVYEKPAERQHCSPTRSNEDLGASQGGNHDDVRQRGQLSIGDGLAVRGDFGGLPAGFEADGYCLEVKGQAGAGQWQVQGRDAKHGVSVDDREDTLQSVQPHRSISDPSSGRSAYEQHAREFGSALLAVPFQPPQAGMVELPKGFGVLTDPPYGIGADKNLRANKKHGAAAAPSKDYGAGDWDGKPADISWMRGISCPAIVWGGNYFELGASSCWLVWDKENGNNGYADCELAWTNLPQAVRRIKWRWAGMLQQDMANKEDRVHPTQKPLEVMRWCLSFLPDDLTILDPFMGSGTTGVACAKLGRKFIGIELDPDYFDIACKRVREAYAQPDMFIEAKPKPAVQEGLPL